MKKNIILAVASAAFMLLLSASCAKQEEFKSEIASGGKTFTAIISQNPVRTSITGEYKVNWEEGDLININGSVYSATPKSPATSADFTKVSGDEPSAPYAAIYPSSLCGKDSKYELPAIQEYLAGSFYAPMYATGNSETLEFKNICGVICFEVKGTDKVKSIKVSANEPVCGTFVMTDATTMAITGNEGKSVTLDCGEGVQLDAETATKFYVFLPPMEYTAGMNFVFKTTDDKVFTKSTGATAKVERNLIYTIAVTPAFKEQTANCYIAKPGATISFPAFKGNSDEALDCDAASLVWQDNASLVKSVAIAGNKITVALNDAQEGNAVVAAEKSGVVVWSWHIWVSNAGANDVTVGGYTFMDRNVGALTIDEKSEKSIGVIYQYGRKDPFPGIKGYDVEKSAYVISDIYNAEGQTVAVEIKDNTEANNIANSIKNPQAFYKNYYYSGQKHNYSWITTDATTFDPEVFKGLWENNGVKSVYDPCPAGYKVASIAAWDAAKTQSVTEIWNDAYVTPDASAIGTNERYIAGNKKKVQFRGCIYGGLRLTATGEVNANTGKDIFEFAIANCVGKALPTAEVWCADIDPDFPAKLSASYFRGTAVKVNTIGNGNYDDISAIKVNDLSTSGKYGLNYALPVRCVKE